VIVFSEGHAANCGERSATTPPSYADAVLRHYFPAVLAVISNIAAG
jgi:hypothetical protein